MKSASLLAALTLSLLVAAGAHAERYEGVTQSVSVLARADVNAEAVQAAAAPDQNVAAGSRGAGPFVSVADAANVRAQAVAAAAAPNQNVVPGSRYMSRIVPTLANPAEARAALASNGTSAVK